MEPVSGKRYTFPLCIPPDGREKSGLFEKLDEHGLAIIITRDGKRWHIPCENIKAPQSG